MTVLNYIYCALGALFVVLGVACLIEKYRTVRGAVLLPARILKCEKEVKGSKASGGYCYSVQLDTPDGRRTARTNDAFWFNKEKCEGNIIEVWYNPQTPEKVERKSYGAEALSAFMIALGLAVIFCLGLG